MSSMRTNQIGTLNSFSSFNFNKLNSLLFFLLDDEITLSEELAGYCVMFTATHGNDDLIPEVDEDEE